MKVGKAKVAFKAPPQAIIRPTGRASVIRKWIRKGWKRGVLIVAEGLRMIF